MERNQLGAEQVVARGDALGDGDVDFALLVHETGYTPHAAGVETILVDLEPCFSPRVSVCTAREEEGFLHLRPVTVVVRALSTFAR